MAVLYIYPIYADERDSGDVTQRRAFHQRWQALVQPATSSTSTSFFFLKVKDIGWVVLFPSAAHHNG